MLVVDGNVAYVKIIFSVNALNALVIVLSEFSKRSHKKSPKTSNANELPISSLI